MEIPKSKSRQNKRLHSEFFNLRSHFEEKQSIDNFEKARVNIKRLKYQAIMLKQGRHNPGKFMKNTDKPMDGQLKKLIQLQKQEIENELSKNDDIKKAKP